ncbi:hypothetical protein PT974_11322 [Cladobotryum mycophilum]|uniref:Ankyrin repeat protein n=1 Tax=Cladobotryum mycophilum TaxID=491253 RepID=A0ABR0S697_9HYPO
MAVLKSFLLKAYTCGVDLCPISKELSAAKSVLDESHAPLASKSPHEGNSYTIGSISNHTVVIAKSTKAESEGIFGHTELTVKREKLCAIKLLPKRRADFQPNDTLGLTLLWLVAQGRNQVTIQLLLEHGADPEMVNMYGHTILP